MHGNVNRGVRLVFSLPVGRIHTFVTKILVLLAVAAVPAQRQKMRPPHAKHRLSRKVFGAARMAMGRENTFQTGATHKQNVKRA
jgi:hypothetical protein